MDEPDFADCDLMSVLEEPDDMAEGVVGCDEVNGPTEVVQVVSDVDEWRAGRRVSTRRQRLTAIKIISRCGRCTFSRNKGYRLRQHETTNSEVQLQSSSSSSQPPGFGSCI